MYKGVRAFEVEWVGRDPKSFEPARNIKHTKVYKDYIKNNK